MSEEKIKKKLECQFFSLVGHILSSSEESWTKEYSECCLNSLGSDTSMNYTGLASDPLITNIKVLDINILLFGFQLLSIFLVVGVVFEVVKRFIFVGRILLVGS